MLIHGYPLDGRNGCGMGTATNSTRSASGRPHRAPYTRLLSAASRLSVKAAFIGCQSNGNDRRILSDQGRGITPTTSASWTATANPRVPGSWMRCLDSRCARDARSPAGGWRSRRIGGLTCLRPRTRAGRKPGKNIRSARLVPGEHIASQSAHTITGRLRRAERHGAASRCFQESER